MTECNFPYDNNINIKLFTHKYCNFYPGTAFSEKRLRTIISQLIQMQIIKGNIIDGGAYIGDNSIPWAMIQNNKVYAIDPSSKNCKFMSKLAKINNISNLEIIECALSDKNGIVGTNDDLHHCNFNNDVALCKIVTDAYSLDYLYKINKIENIGFIHLDVEGFEFRVIIGSEQIINLFRPIICFEQHVETENYMEICKHLSNKNYETYVINEVAGNNHDCRNLIAFPKEIGNDFISIINKDAQLLTKL